MIIPFPCVSDQSHALSVTEEFQSGIKGHTKRQGVNGCPPTLYAWIADGKSHPMPFGFDKNKRALIFPTKAMPKVKLIILQTFPAFESVFLCSLVGAIRNLQVMSQFPALVMLVHLTKECYAIVNHGLQARTEDYFQARPSIWILTLHLG